MNLRRIANLLVLWTTLSAWLLGSVSQPLHELTAHHVRCAEHGMWMEAELNVVSSDGGHHDAPAAHKDATPPNAHEHGCAFAGHGTPTPPPVLAVVAAVADATPELVNAALPIPPPTAAVLAYAPKTDPPLTALPA